ncbi:MAG: hypothetical protein JOY82_06420 [Streptosporangiaceae bacterium]|nr:hypothetical protein [Streptosporangiaceae bacterium]MBV9854145.1 hypothetical protein [Streptosporangiaceae bacterium]
MVALIAAGYLLLHRTVGQAFAAAGLATGLAAAGAGLAAALALVAVSAAAIRRRRAAAGACTTCRFRCQQAIPQPRRALRVSLSAMPVPRRPVLVARYDRGSTAAPAPQWPHRPLTSAPQPWAQGPRCRRAAPDGAGPAVRAVGVAARGTPATAVNTTAHAPSAPAVGITARAPSAPSAREKRDATGDTGARLAEYCETAAAGHGS